MAKAFLKAAWVDTNADETITHIQVSSDSPSMIAHEVDVSTGRGWMNIGTVPANVSEFPFALDLPFTFVRVRVRPAKLGARPTAWEPQDGFLLNVSVDGAPINVVSAVNLDITSAPETGTPGPVTPPPPSSIIDLGVDPGGEDEELDISFTAVNDGTGAAAKYRVRYVEGTTPPINWDAALPATASCGTATPPTSIGDPVTCTIDGLNPGTSYQVQAESYRGVIGTNAVFGGRSNIDTATTTGAEPVILPGPQNLQPQGTVVAGSTTFSWNPVATADEYEIRIHVHGQPYTPLTVPTFYLVAGRQVGTSVNATLAAGQNYDWWIAAVKSNVVGLTTGASTFVAPGTPTNPTPLSLLPSPTTVEVGSVRNLTVTLTGTYNQPVVVTLQSNNVPSATVPSSITIPVDSIAGSFNVSGIAVGSATISATYNGTTRNAAVTVEAAVPPVGGLWPNEPSGMTLKTDWGFPVLQGSGWLDPYGPGASLMSIVSNQGGPISPANALQASFPVGHPGGNGTGNINYQFTPGLRTMYVGFWVKFSNPFQWHPTTQKVIFFTANGGNSFTSILGVEGGTQRVWITGNAGANIDNRHLPGVGFVGSWNMYSSGVITTLNRWYRIETLMRESATNTSRDGLFRVWLDGAQVMNVTNANTDQFGGYTGVIYNPVFGGGTQVTKQEQDFMWYDHCRISGTNS